MKASWDYYEKGMGNEATVKWMLSLEGDLFVSSLVDRFGDMTEKQIIKAVQQADAIPTEIVNERLVRNVRQISNDYMNNGKGDGTVGHTMSDDEIILKFRNKKMTTVEKMVKRIDKDGADIFNQVRMFSGEYEMINGIAEPKN
jgi:hypothetical protein